jgi:hypothetical protein
MRGMRNPLERAIHRLYTQTYGLPQTSGLAVCLESNALLTVFILLDEDGPQSLQEAI